MSLQKKLRDDESSDIVDHLIVHAETAKQVMHNGTESRLAEISNFRDNVNCFP